MTKIRVVPDMLNQQGAAVSDIAREVQQLQERMQQRIQSMSWESRHRAQVEQRLAQCRAACQSVVSRLEQNRGQLVKRRVIFRRRINRSAAISTSANNRWPRSVRICCFRRVWHRTETRARNRP